MLLDDIADYLSTGGVANVFKDIAPDSPDTVTSVYGTGGRPSTHTMVAPHVLEEPRVNVVCRAKDLQTAHQNAKTVYGLLNGVRNKTLNGVLYHWVVAVEEPKSLFRDQNARFAVACNYDIKKDRST